MSVVKNLSFSVLTSVWILAVNAFLNLVTPYYISVEDYGLFRVFMLYASFSGLLHFGYLNGIYLLYGGKHTEEISFEEIKYHRYFLLSFQCIIGLIVFFIGYYTGNKFICYFAIVSVLNNLFVFGNFFFQAVNRFDISGKVNFFTNLYILVCLGLLFFVFELTDYHYLIYVIISCSLVGALINEFYYRKELKNTIPFYPTKKDILEVFSLGVFISIGNILLVYLFMVDRWLINLFFSIEIFAYYSFSIAILTIVISVVTSVSLVVYPILIRNYSEDSINKIKVLTLVMAATGQVLYFIAHIFIIEVFPKYMSSLEVLRYMFLRLPALSLIIVISANYYKINKVGKHFTIDLAIMGIIATAINGVIYLVVPDPVFIALGTFLTFNIALWVMNRRNKDFTFEIKDFAFYGISTISYFVITCLPLNMYISIVIYLIIVVFLSLLYYKNHMVLFCNILLRSLKLKTLK